jgi:hypothetical protein
VEEDEITMTTINGLPNSWESFIQGILCRRKLTKFSRLWEKIERNEDKVITTHARKGKNKK